MAVTLRVLGLAAAFCLVVGGCAYDPTFQLSCDDEGATQGSKECRDGVWVSAEGADVGDTGGDEDAGGDRDGATEPDATEPDMAVCVAETNIEFCARLGLDCDEVTAPDNCGDERTLSCGMCTAPQACGDGDPNTCGCVAETDADFCTRLVKTCDDVSDADNCGDQRTVNCGACMLPAVCGGGGTSNVCACPDQTDQEFCDVYGALCGALTEIDECGQLRTTSCGTCTSPETCGAETANQCACPMDADVCTTLGYQCGTADVTTICTNKTMIACGGCQPDASCGATNQCACDMGFVDDGLGNCIDVDECMTMTDNCHANATCTNMPAGSFTCTCDMGYAGDGVTCADIDECMTMTDNCHANATCTNMPAGGFTCACDTGYTGDGVACADIDECMTMTDNCHANATCTDMPAGSFTCACDTGYTGDGVACADIDECMTMTDNCHANATCTNMPAGSFTCACDTGYTGDGGDVHRYRRVRDDDGQLRRQRDLRGHTRR